MGKQAARMRGSMWASYRECPTAQKLFFPFFLELSMTALVIAFCHRPRTTSLTASLFCSSCTSFSISRRHGSYLHQAATMLS